MGRVAKILMRVRTSGWPLLCPPRRKGAGGLVFQLSLLATEPSEHQKPDPLKPIALVTRVDSRAQERPRVSLRDRQQFQCCVLRPARALLPAPDGIRADIQVDGEQRLAGFE